MKASLSMRPTLTDECTHIKRTESRMIMMTITISMPITNDAKKSFPLQNDAAADDEEDDFPDIFSLKDIVCTLFTLIFSRK
jgi:hypothetical protein